MPVCPLRRIGSDVRITGRRETHPIPAVRLMGEHDPAATHPNRAQRSDPTSGSEADADADADADAEPGSVAGSSSDVVELRVSARAEMVSTVRAMVAHLAGRADFDIDTISDLRLAVDEACSSLIQLAAPTATLDCVFIVSADAMQVAVGTMVDPPEAVVDISGFGWQLLRALSDHTELERDSDGRVGRLVIRLAKQAYRL
jgi:serine/threonine-protein kinase RsbW